MKKLAVLVLSLPLTLAAACHGKSPPTAPDGAEGLTTARPARQIVLRLKDGRDPSEKNLLRELSATAGLPLRYVRPMAGDAHVLAAEDRVSDAELDRAVDRLARQPRVQYASRDRMKQHQ